MFRAFVGAGGAARRAAHLLFARLPVLARGTATAARLRALGLWSEGARLGCELLQRLCAARPRYFRGRRVLARGGLATLVHMPPAGQGQGQAQAQAQEQEWGGDAVVVAHGGKRVRVPVAELLALNQRHVLPARGTATGAGGGSAGAGPVLVLEDGLRADLGSPLMRAKLAQVALVLNGTMERVLELLGVPSVPGGQCAEGAGGKPGAGGSAGDCADDRTLAALDEMRCDAVRAVRGCLDLTTP
eukprot:g4638.t1